MRITRKFKNTAHCQSLTLSRAHFNNTVQSCDPSENTRLSFLYSFCPSSFRSWRWRRLITMTGWKAATTAPFASGNITIPKPLALPPPLSCFPSWSWPFFSPLNLFTFHFFSSPLPAGPLPKTSCNQLSFRPSKPTSQEETCIDLSAHSY